MGTVWLANYMTEKSLFWSPKQVCFDHQNSPKIRKFHLKLSREDAGLFQATISC